MTIPDWNASGVLPPYLGSPTIASHVSPYPTTAKELCAKLGFSADRRIILRGWLKLRDLLRTLGHDSGFQWVNGSFMEDSENRRGRPPGDIDVVSFLPASPAKLDP